MLIHAATRYPDVITSELWHFTLEYSAYLWNITPKLQQLSPEEVFYRAKMDYYELHQAHVWGCPTYTLNYCFQNGQKLPKWELRARRGIFLGISKRHSSNVPQVLHLSTGAISPQYHVVFDDYFQTVSSTEVDVPQSWENLFTYSTQHWFEEEDFNEEVADWLDVSLENRMKISENKRAQYRASMGVNPPNPELKRAQYRATPTIAEKIQTPRWRNDGLFLGVTRAQYWAIQSLL